MTKDVPTNNKYNIKLICTYHGETGLCNVNILYRALKILDPEVLFEEIPPSAYDAFYKDKVRANLEATTINRFLENHHLMHIPVDYDEVPDSFFKNDRLMHKKIEANCREYRNIIDTQSIYTRQYGFKYLNSDYSVELYRQLRNAIENALERLDDKKLFEINSAWKEMLETRDRTMLENIYSYCENHYFDRGVFFVGAAHRESIIKKIKEYETNGIGKIRWSYVDYDSIF